MIVLLVDAERCELAGRELEVDHLVLGADQLDPAGVRHGQDLGARRPRHSRAAGAG